MRRLPADPAGPHLLFACPMPRDAYQVPRSYSAARSPHSLGGGGYSSRQPNRPVLVERRGNEPPGKSPRPGGASAPHMPTWQSFSHVERDRDLSLRTVTAPATYAFLQHKATYASSTKEHDLKLMLDLWTTVRDEGPPASPLTTLAVGTGLRQASVGRSALFVLMNNDPNGRALHVGGAPWSVHVTGPGKVVTSIVDHDDGTVTVRYTCSCSGLHRVYVRLHDDHLAGSPFDVQVAVGLPAPCVVKRAAASARTLRGLMTRWAALSRVRPVHEERARFASNTAALAELRVVFELVKVGVQHLMAQRLARGLRAFCDVAAQRRATLEAVRRALRRLLGYQQRSGIRQWKRKAERLREDALAYAKMRMQFGKVIAGFQSMKHKQADMLMEVELAKSAAYYAAAALDEGDADGAVAASIAKAAASEAYLQTAIHAVQIHGGIGFTWDNETHLWFKRAKASEVMLGDATLHRERMMQAMVESA